MHSRTWSIPQSISQPTSLRSLVLGLIQGNQQTMTRKSARIQHKIFQGDQQYICVTYVVYLPSHCGL